MAREEDAARGVDFSRRYRRRGHSRMHILQPSPSRHGWYESLILVAAGLIGGFGLGLAFAMLTIVS